MSGDKLNRAMGSIDDELIEESLLYEEKRRNDLKRRKAMTARVNLKKWIAVAAALALIITATVFIGTRLASNDPTSIVALDVNPSIELEVNGKGKVIDVDALNEDAETVIGDMELDGVQIDVAVNAIVGSMLSNGYITTDKNSILVSVNSGNADEANALKESLSAKISALLGDKNITASVITQTFDKNEETNKQAQDNKISPAKATLINKIVTARVTDANGVIYTYERLTTLNINELKLILDSKALDIEGIVSSGLASEGAYIGSEEAKAKALESAGLAVGDVTALKVEIDFDDDRRMLVYEVEFVSGGKKYEYEIAAKIEMNGEILDEEIELEDEDDDREPTLPSGYLDRASILSRVLEDAKVAAEAAFDIDIEIEFENRRFVYSIEFKSAGKEYEYILNAMTGEIIFSEVELDD